MIPQFLSHRPVHVLNESARPKVLCLTPEAIGRYYAMKGKNGAPMYQFMTPHGTGIVQKGQDVDYYDENGDKKYGIVQSVNAATGVVKVKSGQTVAEVIGYPKGVIR
uniref:Uncharacterized protein n=1 Tax=Pseudomonas phage Cygsa01 TaxID=3138529 RepID=A0AAU6W3X9_9VIRU